MLPPSNLAPKVTAMVKNSGFSEVQREQDAFDAQIDQLLREHEGAFVIFKNGVPVAFFDDYQTAYSAALDRFGVNDTFLVSEVKRRRPQTTSITWQVGAL